MRIRYLFMLFVAVIAVSLPAVLSGQRAEAINPCSGPHPKEGCNPDPSPEEPTTTTRPPTTTTSTTVSGQPGPPDLRWRLMFDSSGEWIVSGFAHDPAGGPVMIDVQFEGKSVETIAPFLGNDYFDGQIIYGYPVKDRLAGGSSMCVTAYSQKSKLSTQVCQHQDLPHPFWQVIFRNCEVANGISRGESEFDERGDYIALKGLDDPGAFGEARATIANNAPFGPGIVLKSASIAAVKCAIARTGAAQIELTIEPDCGWFHCTKRYVTTTLIDSAARGHTAVPTGTAVVRTGIEGSGWVVLEDGKREIGSVRHDDSGPDYAWTISRDDAHGGLSATSVGIAVPAPWAVFVDSFDPNTFWGLASGADVTLLWHMRRN